MARGWDISEQATCPSPPGRAGFDKVLALSAFFYVVCYLLSFLGMRLPALSWPVYRVTTRRDWLPG